MFILHSSNKTENLVAHLTAVIRNSPLSSPFAKEAFLIQSQGMERWLSQQLASEFGVWAHTDFFFPDKFFSHLAKQLDSRLSDAAFDRNAMCWRIEALLQTLGKQSPDAVFLPLTHYLTGENVALKRYQLAKQLAQIFDQYQMMRPELLDQWQQGRSVYQSDSERWQQALWQRITQQTGSKHRGALWQEVIAKLHDAKEDTFSQSLPERICVFGLNTMPPLFLDYLQGLSKHCQLHLFLLNPAQTFWADLASKRQQLVEEDCYGHPLLSALGQQGREFQQMLLEQAQFDFEPESFELSAALSNLHQLQNDILNNQLECINLTKDDSISLHACHSRLREVEVLKNQLLQTLEQNPTLQLRDMVVMAPDIQAYEPFISAVFNDIQHAIADRSLRLTNRALDAFIRFLNISQSRFGWQIVLDLLEQEVIYPHFGLSETDLELVKYWLQETHVRWGKSARHREQLGLPEFDQNTWQATLDRLLMGYAVGQDDEFVDDILPYKDIEGSSAQALGGLCQFMQLLFTASEALKQPKSLTVWSQQLLFYAEQLLGGAEAIERQQLNELLTELASADNDNIELSVVIAWLEGMVAERKSANGFLRGQLTFCSMLPMRSIPFKVIALLGMNDGEFPQIDRNPSFDLLSQPEHFRKGDRSRRADDRYQFLEILLSARQQLIITYIGQSQSDNSSLPPSVVISELLEVLQDNYQLANLVTRHPLHAFSAHYFTESSELFSFSQSDCATAQALQQRQTNEQPATAWWQGALSTEPAQIIELNDLFNFFRHPQRQFMRTQLGLRFTPLSADSEEREPFVVNRMESYAIQQEWIDAALNGSTLSAKKLQARGQWLPGTLGELEFTRQQQAIDGFVQRISAKNMGPAIDDLAIDISINDYRLVGNLVNRHQNGSLFYRYADLKGKDFVCTWLHHLIINQLEPQTTELLSADEDITLLPEYCQAEHLPIWLDIYLQGQSMPGAFFVDPALAYIKQAHKLTISNRASKSALDTAHEQLVSAINKSYEPELRRLYGTLPETTLLLDETFEQHCQQLLQPIWNATHS